MDKKKDLMSSAFDDFWASGKMQSNTPRARTSEDDAYDAFWKRGSFAPQPRIQRPQVNYQVPQRQPVPNYRPQVNQGLTQQQQYELAKQRLQLQAKIRQAQLARQRPQNNARTNTFIGSLIKGVAKTAVSAGKEYGSKAQTYAKEKVAQSQYGTDRAIIKERVNVEKEFKKQQREDRIKEAKQRQEDIHYEYKIQKEYKEKQRKDKQKKMKEEYANRLEGNTPFGKLF